jgi:serine/threonine protein phosphatase PrpC
MPVLLLQAFNSRTCLMSLIKWRRNIDMKKPTLQIQEQQPRNIQRADIAPANGFAPVVDGHSKTEFGSENAAQKAAQELLTQFPKLQQHISNHGSNRTRLEIPHRRVERPVEFASRHLHL